jgi:hypothetical protein
MSANLNFEVQWTEKYVANDGGCSEFAAKTALRQKRWEQKNKMPKRELEKDKQHQMKKHTRLNEEIKGRIGQINDNLSQEKPRVTYWNSIGRQLGAPKAEFDFDLRAGMKHNERGLTAPYYCLIVSYCYFIPFDSLTYIFDNHNSNSRYY